jgi:AcrR family transcriptional regulator
MLSSVGRPREHDETTREALRDAAEHLFEAGGVEAVSVRAVAAAVGTTTRAVYSLFGSRDGLLIDALVVRAFDLLTAATDAHPETDDPVADLIDMAPNVFRRFALDHPALFRITFQRPVPHFEPGPELVAARNAGIASLTRKVQRLEQVGMLRQKPLTQAVVEFQAMCEGLANLELRDPSIRILPVGGEETAWRAAFENLVPAFA